MVVVALIILLAIALITANLVRLYKKRQENYIDNPRYITGTPYFSEKDPDYSEYNQYVTYDEYSGCDKPINPIYVQYEKNIPSTLPASNKMWTAPDSGTYINLL